MSVMRENKETLGTSSCFEQGENRSGTTAVNCIGQLTFDELSTEQRRQFDAHQDSNRAHLFPSRESILIPEGEKIETPTDSRGIVDLGRLITEVTAYVDPGYEWGRETDRHHLHWFSSIYKGANLFMQNEALGREFRGLPIHIVWIPKDLHAFIHTITLPVEAPSEEVMAYRIESWRVAYLLFNATKAIMNHRYLSNEQMARKVTRELIEEQFRRLEIGIKSAENLPHEFRFFETHQAKKIVGAREVSHVRKQDLVKALKSFEPVKKSLSRETLTLENVHQFAA